MDKLAELEIYLDKPINSWVITDIEKLITDEKIRKNMLNEDTVNKILSRTTNTDIYDIFYLIKIHIDHKNAILEMGKIYYTFNKSTKNNKSRKTFIESIEKVISSDNTLTFSRLIGYGFLIELFEDYDLQKYENKIKTDFTKLKKIILSFSTVLNSEFAFVTSLLDLFFPLRTKYYKKYNIDILDDSDKEFDIFYKEYEKIYMIQEELCTKQQTINNPDKVLSDLNLINPDDCNKDKRKEDDTLGK